MRAGVGRPPAAWRALAAGLVALVAAPAAGVESVHVLGLFADRAIVSIDGKQRMLVKGETSPEGVTLVGATSESAVLEFDGQRRTLTLGRHITTVYRGPEPGLALQIWPTSQGMYRTVGSINGYPVNFLVDTGATLIAMSRAEARRLGIDYLVVGRPERARTASGVVATYAVTLARVKVGEIELREVAASVVDGDFPTEVLLGNSFLNRLEMRREGQMLELRTRP